MKLGKGDTLLILLSAWDRSRDSKEKKTSKDMSYDIKQDICNKFIEVNFCVGCMVFWPNCLLHTPLNIIWSLIRRCNKNSKKIMYSQNEWLSQTAPTFHAEGVPEFLGFSLYQFGLWIPEETFAHLLCKLRCRIFWFFSQPLKTREIYT